MADRDDKTYAPLPRRRQRAREQGEIARSPEMTGAITFLIIALGFSAATSTIANFTVYVFRAAIGSWASPNATSGVERSLVYATVALLAALAVNATVGTLAAISQGGVVFAPMRALPDLGRASPARYLSRVFSPASLLDLAKTLIRVAAIAYLGWSTARQALGLDFAQASLASALLTLSYCARHFLLLSGAVALAVAAFDYLYRRYEYERELRMTRQEFMDELKQELGDPRVRRAIRRAQQRAHKRMRGVSQAATATVVLVNPTHIAVALRYRRGFDKAPLVVAKGAGEGASRIVLIARLAAVPVVTNRPLARALYRSVEVGDFIPQQFYRAVAEVLAFVIRSTAQGQGKPGSASSTYGAQKDESRSNNHDGLESAADFGLGDDGDKGLGVD